MLTVLPARLALIPPPPQTKNVRRRSTGIHDTTASSSVSWSWLLRTYTRTTPHPLPGYDRAWMSMSSRTYRGDVVDVKEKPNLGAPAYEKHASKGVTRTPARYEQIAAGGAYGTRQRWAGRSRPAGAWRRPCGREERRPIGCGRGGGTARPAPGWPSGLWPHETKTPVLAGIGGEPVTQLTRIRPTHGSVWPHPPGQ